MTRRRKDEVEEATEFLGYLRRHPASNTLADSIAEVIAVRRAAAARRARNLRMTSAEVHRGRAAC
jgi:hypothetical protein